jgi:hypothetical protein
MMQPGDVHDEIHHRDNEGKDSPSVLKRYGPTAIDFFTHRVN